MSTPTTRTRRTLSLTLWAIFLIIILGVTGIFTGIGRGAFGELPSFEELENPQSMLATEVFSADGVLLGKYYSENRSNVRYENLPDHLVEALVATEDERFHGHAGIDFEAVARAVVKLGRDGGGSTITQQLAKNLFRTRANRIRERADTEHAYEPTALERLVNSNRLTRLVFAKLKEWVLAVRLERSYTKEEIIAMYFNTVDFIYNSYGIKSAARTYFDTTPDSLTIEESAVLVAMLKAPATYNPLKNPDRSRDRRNVVLGQMQRNGYIDQTAYDSLRALPLRTQYTPTDHIEGLAPYFRESLRMYLHDWAATHFKPDGEPYDIYRDGLQIFTTLDSRMQVHAENALRAHIDSMQDIFWDHWEGRDPWRDYPEELKKVYSRTNRYVHMRDSMGMAEDEIMEVMTTPIEMEVFDWDEGLKDTILSPIDSIRYYRMHLQGGFLAVDPVTGFIKAWVGGIDYKHFKYDHVNVNAKRQVGSTFKPFIYAVALRDQFPSPCFRIPNEKITFEKDAPRWGLLEDWTPQNADGEYGGMKTIKEGLAQSINVVAARLMYKLTPESVIAFVRDLGVTSSIDPVPSICLGTADISLQEMVGAYTAFANEGIYTEPTFMMRIEDKNGNILEEFYPEQREVMNEELAYVMLDLMQGVVNQPGATGHRIRWKYGLDGDIAGKTGTTQNNSDGWFMGITPELVAGTWVGCDDRFVRFRYTQYGQGASLALPIYARFLQAVRADERLGLAEPARFEKPDFELSRVLDCSRFDQGEDQNPENAWME